MDHLARATGVNAVDRAISLMEAFQAGEASLSLGELSARTGLHKSTVLRLAASLAKARCMVKQADGAWRLGPALARLGLNYQMSFRLTDIVMPVLRRLSTETSESATFYVREGDMRVRLCRVDSQQSIRDRPPPALLPLQLGAAGRVLLAFSGEPGAFYDDIRRAGHYLSLGERDPQIASMACPVFGAGGGFMGCLTVSGPKTRFDPATSEHVLAILSNAAQETSAVLGHVPRPA